MATEIRSFFIPDEDPDVAQERVSAFLRQVEVERIDTSYAQGGWRLLVIYQDLRWKEESAQIEVAIAHALNSWRERTARVEGVSREELLPEELVSEVARFAPTTERELGVIVGTRSFDVGNHGGEIVQVVRATLDELID